MHAIQIQTVTLKGAINLDSADSRESRGNGESMAKVDVSVRVTDCLANTSSNVQAGTFFVTYKKCNFHCRFYNNTDAFP